jgi:hypothetical protein
MIRPNVQRAWRHNHSIRTLSLTAAFGASSFLPVLNHFCNSYSWQPLNVEAGV